MRSGRRKGGKNGEVGPPVHDDLVGRAFTADALNRLWLADINRFDEHGMDFPVVAPSDSASAHHRSGR